MVTKAYPRDRPPPPGSSGRRKEGRKERGCRGQGMVGHLVVGGWTGPARLDDTGGEGGRIIFGAGSGRTKARTR